MVTLYCRLIVAYIVAFLALAATVHSMVSPEVGAGWTVILGVAFLITAFGVIPSGIRVLNGVLERCTTFDRLIREEIEIMREQQGTDIFTKEMMETVADRAQARFESIYPDMKEKEDD